MLAGVLDFSAHSKNQQSLERTMERWNLFFGGGHLSQLTTPSRFSGGGGAKNQESTLRALIPAEGKAAYIYIEIKIKKV